MAGEEIGLSGLNWSGGYVDEELLPTLHGREAIRIYREMADNDPVVGSVLFAIDMLIRQVEWRVEPNPDGKDEDAEFLESCMEDMSHSWADLISEIMSMLRFGFSFHEIVYKKRSGYQKPDADVPSSKYDDGKIGWRKIELRAQESLDRWEFDENGGVKAFVQKPPPFYDDRVIPIEKGLLFRTSRYKNNPEGRSILRNAYRPWKFKKRIEEIEGVGIERDLAGLPFAKVDPAILRTEASDEEKAILSSIQNIVKNVRQDRQAGIIWPNIKDEDGNPLYEFTLLNSGGSRMFDTSAIIERYDRRITMTALADFILLGHEKVGSFALSNDKTDLFAVALGAWLKNIQDVFNRFAVPRLFEVNGMDTKNMPEIKHGDIESPDLTKLSAYISTLGGMGMPIFPDENLEKHLRKIANLPEPSEEAQELNEAKMEEEMRRLTAGQGEQQPPPLQTQGGGDEPAQSGGAGPSGNGSGPGGVGVGGGPGGQQG